MAIYSLIKIDKIQYIDNNSNGFRKFCIFNTRKYAIINKHIPVAVEVEFVIVLAVQHYDNLIVKRVVDQVQAVLRYHFAIVVVAVQRLFH